MAHRTRHLLASVVTLTGVTLATAAFAQSPQVVPDRMEQPTEKFRKDTAGVGITEHLGSTINLDLQFTDSTGRPATLRQFFKPGRPVLLQLGYFNCPQLCDVVSKGVMEGVKALPLEMAKDYSMLYVSVDPEEDWELGQSKKRTYVASYGKPGAVEGWNFLVGKQQFIKPLADEIGFGYKKLDGKEEFSHPPMVVVLTGDGKISQYLYGFQYPSELLATSIKEAGENKVGKSIPQILVALCYHFDEYSGKYSLAYMRLMQAGGVLTVLVVGTWLGTRWLREARASRQAGATATHP